MPFNFEDLKDSGALEDLKSIRRGIEKESLRIDSLGSISTQEHPKALGSALTNSFVTTDFSEALLELVTPTFIEVKECIDFLEQIHVFVHRSIGDELLWPLSMPCPVDSEEEIPIAYYGTSNSGLMKRAYREGLAQRYGRKMQAIAGIHYNFSFPNSFFKKIIQHKKERESLKDIKNQSYLGLARNFKRMEWLYFLLFGASPAIPENFTDKKLDNFKNLNYGGSYKTFATSLRMGSLGYISEVQDDLNISMNSLEEYCRDLRIALSKKHHVYEKIGEFDSDRRIQLNSSVIQIENEYYNTIRPKRICPPGKRPINILKQDGIDYLELRCIDLDPFCPIGINAEQINFLDIFLIFCLLKPSPPLTKDEMSHLKTNHEKIINSGREPKLTLFYEGKELQVQKAAELLLDEIKEVCLIVESFILQKDDSSSWQESIKLQKNKVKDFGKTPSHKLISKLEKDKISYTELGVTIASENKSFFKNCKDRSIKTLEEEAIVSNIKQKKLETSQEKSFEEYLDNFLGQVS